MNKRFPWAIVILIITAISCSKQQPSSQPTPTPTALLTMDLDKAISTPAQAAFPLPTETPTPEPPEYVMEKIKGTVILKSQDSAEPEEAEEEETVESGDEIITKDNSEASLTLNENTLFHLGPNSDVKVSQLVWNKSNGFISRLELLGGQILSEVEKLAQSDSTFEVNSGGVVCGVRGTAFEVQNQGGAVHMSTFHGVVEMKKDSLVQRVNANEHAAFLIKKGAFLPKRALKPAERNHYQVWLRQKAVVQKKFQQRQALRRSMERLTPEEKNRILQKMGQTRPRNRLKIMRQELRKNPVENPGIKNKRPIQPGKKEPLSKRAPALPKARPPLKPGSFQKRPGQKFQPHTGKPALGIKKRPGQNLLRPNRALSQPRKPFQAVKNKPQPPNKKKPNNKKKKKEEDRKK